MEILIGKGYSFIQFWVVFSKIRGQLFCDEVKMSTFFMNYGPVRKTESFKMIKLLNKQVLNKESRVRWPMEFTE